MTGDKRIERTGKHLLRRIAGRLLRPEPVQPERFDRNDVTKILVVRQDARLGNLVLMTPFLRAMRDVFRGSELHVLITGGFEEVYAHNADVDRVILLQRHAARFQPWWLPRFVKELRRGRYDLAVDVSDGRHFSFSNVMLTALSGARYRMGYDREDASRFLNLLVPPPPQGTHMTDALAGLATYWAPDTVIGRMRMPLDDDDRAFAAEGLRARGTTEREAFFVGHTGGRGRKQWGPVNFADLIGRLGGDLGVRVVVIAGPGERDTIGLIRDMTAASFEVLTDQTVRHMAAVIERCDLFISNDTGPMHVAAALGRPTVGIFTSSDYRVYGPRGRNSRIVTGEDGPPVIDDVLVAIMDLLGNDGDAGTDENQDPAAGRNDANGDWYDSETGASGTHERE